MNDHDPLLISVHTPKCAGISFLVWLQETYGAERVYLDYTDDPASPASIMNIDPCGFLEQYRDGYPHLQDKMAVHGHFWVKKYQYLKDAMHITFLRDPVERAISNYFYWQGFPRSLNTVVDYVLEHKLSIEQFCRLPLMRYMYTKTFFRDVDMGIFTFIGQHNSLSQETLRLSKILGIDVRLPVVNTNPSVSYNEKVQEIMANKPLVNRLQDLLSADIKFYEKYAGS